MLQELKQIVILLVISAVSALVFNSLYPKGIALVGSWDVNKGVVSANAKDSVVEHDIEINTVEEAKKRFDEQKTLFVDARDPDSFSEGHIMGAVLMPVYDYDDYFESFIASYPKSQPIVTYCSGRECEDSHKLAQYLKDDGYHDVRVFIDGFPAWLEEGLPVESNH